MTDTADVGFDYEMYAFPMAYMIPPLEPVVPQAEFSFLARLKKDIYASIHDGVTFESWINMTDQGLINLAIDKAWEKFKSALVELG